MDTSLVMLVSIGSAALCFSFVLWLEERRASARSQADVRAVEEEAAHNRKKREVVRVRHPSLSKEQGRGLLL